MCIWNSIGRPGYHIRYPEHCLYALMMAPEDHALGLRGYKLKTRCVSNFIVWFWVKIISYSILAPSYSIESNINVARSVCLRAQLHRTSRTGAEKYLQDMLTRLRHTFASKKVCVLVQKRRNISLAKPRFLLFFLIIFFGFYQTSIS